MKKTFLVLIAVCISFNFDVAAQVKEVKIITVIESLVPGGLGRSRILEETEEPIDADAMAVARTQGNKNAKFEGKRSELKIDGIKETKLLNFYSGVGINFQNIASNDALLSSKVLQMLQKGWELKFVTMGVESDNDAKKNTAIAITRMYFMK